MILPLSFGSSIWTPSSRDKASSLPVAALLGFYLVGSSAHAWYVE